MFGSLVANGYGAASAPPPVSALYSELLPALGRPTSPKRSMRRPRLPRWHDARPVHTDPGSGRATGSAATCTVGDFRGGDLHRLGICTVGGSAPVGVLHRWGFCAGGDPVRPHRALVAATTGRPRRGFGR